ncbi:MAG: thiamine phosphate synthase [Chloroflexi bacterium]|nr:thiamine phosphate synthase [Chloroflexota bacterium]
MLVTDRRRTGGPLEGAVAAGVAGGVNLVQLREYGMFAGDLLAAAHTLKGVTEGRALLLVNDRVDVAVAALADGAHLPEAGLPIAAARAVAGPDRLVGRSVHSVAAARQAAAAGADYLVVGTIYASGSHPDDPPAGPGLLRAIADVVNLPLIAIGGITPANIAEVIAAGASGVAVISAILDAPDPRTAAAELRAALDAAWDARHAAGSSHVLRSKE